MQVEKFFIYEMQFEGQATLASDVSHNAYARQPNPVAEYTNERNL